MRDVEQFDLDLPNLEVPLPLLATGCLLLIVVLIVCVTLWWFGIQWIWFHVLCRPCQL